MTRSRLRPNLRSTTRVSKDSPFSFRRRASSTFIFELGIAAFSWSALLAFRMRVSMSAIGSVSTSSLLPTGLRHPGDGALVGELPQADTANAELAEHRARPPTAVAARVVADLELLGPLLLDDEARLSQVIPSCRLR